MFSIDSDDQIDNNFEKNASAAKAAMPALTTSIKSRYSLTIAVKEYMRNAGDTTVLFESLAHTMLTPSGAGGSRPTTVKDASGSAELASGSCNQYTRGPEMLFLMCPNAIYLFPSERIKTAFLTEATVHVNCSCPFPCLELKILATLPTDVRRHSGKPVKHTNREITSKLTRSQLEQQRTFTRLIGFPSETVLREAVSVLIDMCRYALEGSEGPQDLLPPAPQLRLVFHAHTWDDMTVLGQARTDAPQPQALQTLNPRIDSDDNIRVKLRRLRQGRAPPEVSQPAPKPGAPPAASVGDARRGHAAANRLLDTVESLMSELDTVLTPKTHKRTSPSELSSDTPEKTVGRRSSIFW